MVGLSQNWKKLQSKITPKEGKISKKSKKILKESKKPRTTLASNGGTTKTSEVTHTETQSQTQSQTHKQIPTHATLFEATLWHHENDIAVSDVNNQKETSIMVNKSELKKTEPGKYLAIDCEFVGVGNEGEESALARVSIVNFYGYLVYDKFVKPRERVTDWRTWVSGVSPKHMLQAVPFTEAQKETAALLDGKILVGHAVHHDLKALFLSHPKSMIRDTTTYKPFRAIAGGKTPSLKKLTKEFLKLDIQGAQHSSVEDARATMLLFRINRKEFEQSMRKFKK